MPIFEYACDACGTETSALVRSAEDVPAACSACGAARLVRVISRTNVVGQAAVDPLALRSRPRDFLERPERFGQAMRALSERTGTKLSGAEIDGAMHRLSEAKRKI